LQSTFLLASYLEIQAERKKTMRIRRGILPAHQAQVAHAPEPAAPQIEDLTTQPAPAEPNLSSEEEPSQSGESSGDLEQAASQRVAQIVAGETNKELTKLIVSIVRKELSAAGVPEKKDLEAATSQEVKEELKTAVEEVVLEAVDKRVEEAVDAAPESPSLEETTPSALSDEVPETQ
jgi:hypothetical protein